MMKKLALAAALLFLAGCQSARPIAMAATPTPAPQPAVQPAPVDPLTARARQLWWCIGFNEEIERQATDLNSPLLYDKTQRNVQRYGFEIFGNEDIRQLDHDSFQPAKKAGADSAGAGIWDFSPSQRSRVMAFRRTNDERCDEIATEAGVYKLAFERWTKRK